VIFHVERANLVEFLTFTAFRQPGVASRLVGVGYCRETFMTHQVVFFDGLKRNRAVFVDICPIARISNRMKTEEIMSDTEGGASDFDIATLTVGRMQEDFRSGRLTAESLTKACFAKGEKHNPKYSTLIFLNLQRSTTRAKSTGAAGGLLGPLAGVRVVIKDAMDMVGWSRLYGKMGVDRPLRLSREVDDLQAKAPR
jgi:hypothetical protein